MSLFESRLIWISGPHKAGEYNDIKIFKEKGLKALLEATGKKVIGDQGYQGYPSLISLYNSFDAEEVREFKSRARNRHEKFNGMLKTFECLDSRFRHGREKLQACFEATAVIVQYKMTMMDEPLFDI